MDARENILFLQILLTPCFPTYPIVLILICIPTFSFITDDDTLLHSNDAFVHLIYDLLIMRDNKHGCSTLIRLFQKAHDLPGVRWIQVTCRLIRQQDGRLIYDRPCDRCSPPESSFGNDLYFCASPTSDKAAGTFFLITLPGVSVTRNANAIFS